MKKLLKKSLFLPLLVMVYLSCGNKDNSLNPSGNSTLTGSLVYSDVVKIDGKLVRAVKVLNLANRSERIFETDDFIKEGVSVSKDGLIAQLFDRGQDQAIVRINQLDGTFVKQFVYSEENSFATSGARISPDGKLVAFSLRVQLGSGRSQERVYFCGTGTNNDCYFYENIRDPEWLPDGRLLAVNVYENGTRGGLYATAAPPTVGNTVPTDIFRIGPDNLDNAESPAATPDGKTIIVGLGTLQNIFSIDIATKAVRQITSDGIQQYRPLVSGDGKTLFYMQECCPKDPRAVATRPTIHAIPLKLTTTTNTPISTNYLSDSSGNSINTSGRYGYTTKVLPRN